MDLQPITDEEYEAFLEALFGPVLPETEEREAINQMLDLQKLSDKELQAKPREVLFDTFFRMGLHPEEQAPFLGKPITRVDIEQALGPIFAEQQRRNK